MKTIEMVHIQVAGTFTAERNETFYFGDICYIMKESVYNDFWGEKNKYKDGVYEVPPHGFFAVHGTAYGDGEYRGDHFRYSVDAGVLGLVSEALFDPKRRGEMVRSKLGRLFEIKQGEKIEFSFDKGEFEWKHFDIDNKLLEEEYVDTKLNGDQEEEDEDDDEQGEYDEAITISKEFQIPGTEIILEKGDKIKVESSSGLMGLFRMIEEFLNRSKTVNCTYNIEHNQIIIQSRLSSKTALLIGYGGDNNFQMNSTDPDGELDFQFKDPSDLINWFLQGNLVRYMKWRMR